MPCCSGVSTVAREPGGIEAGYMRLVWNAYRPVLTAAKETAARATVHFSADAALLRYAMEADEPCTVGSKSDIALDRVETK